MKLLNNFQLKSYSFFILVWVASFLVVSCGDMGSGSNGKMSQTRHGFEIEMIKDVKGEAAAENDVILFGMKVYAKDSLLTSTFGDEYDQEFKWLPIEERDKMNNPVVDAFELMSEGDSVHVYLPADSLKGNKFGLVSGDKLKYLLKINKILKGDDYAVYAQERQQKLQAERAIIQARAEEVNELVSGVLAQFKSKSLGSDLIQDPSGLEYVIHEEGTGEKPTQGEKVNVHYYGVLEDGTMFDNSFRRGQVFSFPLGVGQVIPGWDKGIALLNKGSKATLFIPFEMAYGAAGKPPTIPEKSNLVFYVELEE
jgi:FKBP-type peptidyl-prolyl cis-trans isomerase